MSARVDVLAVLEKHHHLAAFGPKPREADELAECRAAVAELIEAAEAVAYVQINRRTPANDLGKAKQIRLRAALTRIGRAP